METNKELDARDGLGYDTSEGEVGSNNPDGASRQPFPNWQDDPEYRKQQSKRDKELAQTKRMAEEASRRAYELENQLTNFQLSGLSGEDRLIAENQLLQRRLRQVDEERELDAFAMNRARDLQEIVAATGVPIEEIEDALNVHTAWKIGNDYAKKRGKPASRQEEIERQADNTVDIGGSKPRSTSAALQERYDRARKSYNLREQLELMAEADSRGVTLRED